MFLYKVEAEMKDGSLLTVVVAAANDEQAFHGAENQLWQYTVAKPAVNRWSLVEKKPLRPGAGYVIRTVPDV